jgi:hypothetical protein
VLRDVVSGQADEGQQQVPQEQQPVALHAAAAAEAVGEEQVPPTHPAAAELQAEGVAPVHLEKEQGQQE